MVSISHSVLHKIARSKVAFFLVFVLCAFAFPGFVSLLSAKALSPGEAPTFSFFVAVVSEGNDHLFQLIPLEQASTESRSFVLPLNESTVRTGEFETIKYRVLERSADRQVIETVKIDDNYTITSRYRIEGRRVVPLMQRAFGPGHGFAGLALALTFCYLLFRLLRRLTQDHANDSPAA